MSTNCCGCHLLCNKDENFSLTFIHTNTEGIDRAFNLVCILKEWEFPAITREFPKKQTSLFENVALSFYTAHF